MMGTGDILIGKESPFHEGGAAGEDVSGSPDEARSTSVEVRGGGRGSSQLGHQARLPPGGGFQAEAGKHGCIDLG